MIRYIIVCVVNGILFGTMDMVINANPLAQKLFQAYKPIARTSVNVPAGVIIDLLYGFVIGFLFLLFYKSLPSASGLVKGILFALVIWFFRVAMQVASSWMMYTIPFATLAYVLITGLLEMLVLGIIYGLFLFPVKS
ncbi:MAG: hypothetical protein JW874_14025 [Spirochaetales bacterium]|nr:hypothetical protein [Spirochaetales bacterium]